MPKAKVIETQVKISGLMDKSVQSAVQNLSKKFEGVGKQFAAFEKVALGAATALTGAFAAAAGVAGKKLMDLSAEFYDAQKAIQIGTGATGEELKELGNIARDVWKTGVGESLQEVSEALANIEQVSGLTGEELKKATKNGMLLKDAFQFEINETARTASALMKNFGISADEAYGIIATGAQNGANKNGDMLDTLNEYSVHYKALGFTADQFITSLIKGAEAGSWSVDKVGDAVKEFTIRSKDGSKKSLEAFQMLGLNGAEMTRAFAAGGDSASDAFNKTVKALKAMKDPVKQNAAGVMLFGTMFEDLEAGVLDTMASMETANIDATKSLADVEKAAQQGIGNTFSRIGRTLKTQFFPVTETINTTLLELAPIFEDLAARAMPYVQEGIKVLNGYFTQGAEEIKKWAANLDFEAIKARVAELIDKFKDMIQWVRDNKDMLFELAKTIGGVYLAIKGLQAGIAIWNGITKAVKFYKDVVTICKAAHAAFTAAQVGSKIAMAASTVATWAQVAATWALNGAIAILTSPITLVIAAIAAVVAAVWLLYKNWDSITAWCGEKWAAFVAAFKAGWDSVSAWFAGIIGKFAPVIETIKGLFTGAWEGIKTAFMTVFDALPAILKAPINGIISIINGAINAINGIGFTIPDWVPLLGGKEFSINIPELPMLAAGGWTNGPSIAGEAGPELVTSFDPAHRAENQRNLATAAEMLGMFAAPKSEASSTVEINLGGINFQPVLKETESGDTLARLRACLPDLVDLITDAIQERTAHIYGN